jgi:hypothetical protein
MNAVNGSLTANQPKDVVENRAFAAFAGRILIAAGRRVADGDVEALADLVNLRSDLDQAIAVAIEGLRSEKWSYSWGDIARVLGVTRQAAQQRYGSAVEDGAA